MTMSALRASLVLWATEFGVRRRAGPSELRKGLKVNAERRSRIPAQGNALGSVGTLSHEL